MVVPDKYYHSDCRLNLSSSSSLFGYSLLYGGPPTFSLGGKEELELVVERRNIGSISLQIEVELTHC
jgi:hypothetical protein